MAGGVVARAGGGKHGVVAGRVVINAVLNQQQCPFLPFFSSACSSFLKDYIMGLVLGYISACSRSRC